MKRWLGRKIFKKEIKTYREQMKIARSKLTDLIHENNELAKELRDHKEMMELYEEEIKRLERELMISNTIISAMSKYLYKKRR